MGRTMVAWLLVGAVFLAGCFRGGFDPPPAAADGSERTDTAASNDLADGGADAPADRAAPLDGLDDLDPDQDPDVGWGPECDDPSCTLWPPCRCLDPQSKCEAISLAERRCVPAGSSGHDEICTSHDDCDPGTICIGIVDSTEAPTTCRQYCVTDQDCAALGPGARCWLSTEVFSLCTSDCDPVAALGCPDGAQCSLYNFELVAGTNCTAPGTAGVGEPCAKHFDCVAGMICYAETCRALCRVGGDDCPTGAACTSTDMTDRATTTYGACL